MFIDNRWVHFIWFLVPLLLFTLYQYKNEIDSNQTLKNTLRFIVGVTTLLSVLFFILAAFITPAWLFGLFVSLGLLLLWGYLAQEVEGSLSIRLKRQILIINATGFLYLFSLFCIPSYVSNNSRNPVDSFSST